MKILLLTDGIYPFQIGGMQRHSSLVINLLVEHKIFVHVMHSGGSGYSREKYFASLPNGRAEFIDETQVDFPTLFRFPGHYIKENQIYSKQLYDVIKPKLKDFDLVYAQGLTASHFIKQKLEDNIPIIVNLHGFEMFQFAPNFKTRIQYLLLAKAAKQLLSGADYIYSFGGKLNDILLNLGIAKDKIIEHSNGVPDEYIIEDKNHINKETQRGINFLFIGRNERRKGVQELKQALKSLLSSHDDSLNIEFNFVGPIDKQDQMNHPKIHYHGEIRNAEKMKTIIDNCDCLVCPSYAEGMPTVILEAMARGLAIIATDVGATSRMIEGNGVLLEKPEVSKLIESMLLIINLPKQDLLNMKLKSIQLVKEKFTWNQVILNKIKDFKKIIGHD